jgi:phosphoglucosamine mutase
MAQGETKRLFGTDGIRGRAGAYPLDERTIVLIGRALVASLTRELGRAPHLVIGRDTRESGPRIEAALARGAAMAGAEVESAGVITTPGVAFITRRTPFDAGVVISASHNPYYDNGIKVFAPSGKKLADEMERAIEADVARAERAEIGGDTIALPRRDAATPDKHPEHEAEYQARYIDYLATEVSGDLSLEGYRIGIDCANGAACEFASRLFERLGASLRVMANAPDGRNINADCGSLHLDHLQRLVVAEKLDLGIAFDGDADRALFVDSAGALVDGDTTLLVLAEFLRAHGQLAGNAVVATVMSNLGLELALKERQIEIVRAQVGDRYVLDELLRRGAALGGEQSGHIIFPAISLAGDGLITAIELLRAVRESGRTLAELAAQMKRYPQVLVNVQVQSKPPLDSLPAIKAAIEELESELQGNGRLLVRYSGTENLARVMIEGEKQSHIDAQANHLAEIIRQTIGASANA